MLWLGCSLDEKEREVHFIFFIFLQGEEMWQIYVCPQITVILCHLFFFFCLSGASRVEYWLNESRFHVSVISLLNAPLSEWACWLRRLSFSVCCVSFIDVTLQRRCRRGERERDVLTEETAWSRKVKKCAEAFWERDDLIWFTCKTQLNKRTTYIV